MKLTQQVKIWETATYVRQPGASKWDQIRRAFSPYDDVEESRRFLGGTFLTVPDRLDTLVITRPVIIQTL